MELQDAEKRQLDEKGFLLLEGVLSEEEVTTYRARLLELAAQEREEGFAVIHTNGYGQHVRWLMNKDPLFECLLVHPRVTPVFAYLLGADYTLSTLTSNIIFPGAPDGAYHVDGALSAMPEPLPAFPVTANSLWLLDDFTPDNGGTRFVPGSHRRCRKPPAGWKDDPEEIRLCASKGSVFLFNGALWHSSGANRTSEARVCLICFCCRSWLKPMFDFVHYVEPEVLARATPELRRLYGFDSQPRGPDRPRE